jgi:hypothetical protein
MHMCNHSNIFFHSTNLCCLIFGSKVFLVVRCIMYLIPQSLLSIRLCLHELLCLYAHDFEIHSSLATL